MKKYLLLCLTALLAIPLGFSQKSMAQDEELTVWVWDINKPILEATIASFQELHPGVTVTVEDIGNGNAYDRGLAGCAAGGQDMPDVYLVENNEAPVFWAQFPDCFHDLREFGVEELTPLFPAFKWTELMRDEAVYAVPFDMGPTAIFYRRDLYEAAGVDPESIETWADFLVAGQAIVEQSGGDVSMATMDKGGDDEWFRMLANEAGCFYFNNEGSAVTVNQPGCVQALETLGELYDGGVLAVGNWDDQLQYISNNNVASSFFGAWYSGVIQATVPDQSGQWGVYLTPAYEAGGIRAANIGGSALAIPASTDNPELAYDFVVNALTNVDNATTTLIDYGLATSLLEVGSSDALNEGSEFFGGQPIWQLIYSNADTVPPTNGTQFYAEARNVMVSIVSDYLDGNYDSAQEALDTAADQIASTTGLPIE